MNFDFRLIGQGIVAMRPNMKFSLLCRSAVYCPSVFDLRALCGPGFRTVFGWRRNAGTVQVAKPTYLGGGSLL
jgi:hypothetical protein